MTFTITITRDEDGVYIAECPAIPGCVSQGKTEAEAQANVRDAIKQCLEVRAEMGMPLTVLTRQVEVIGNAAGSCFSSIRRYQDLSTLWLADGPLERKSYHHD